MDGSEQRNKSNTTGTRAEVGSNNTDTPVTDFTSIPESLHAFITPYKDAIGTGLYYLSLGERKEEVDEEGAEEASGNIPPVAVKEKSKTIRFKLSPVGVEALELLVDQGYSKKAAVIAAIEYLKSKPSTILKVAL